MKRSTRIGSGAVLGLFAVVLGLAAIGRQSAGPNASPAADAWAPVREIVRPETSFRSMDFERPTYFPKGASAEVDALPEGLRTALLDAVEEASYEVFPQANDPAAPSSYQAHNRAQGLRVGFSPKGIHVVPGGSTEGLRMELTGIGYGDRLQSVSDASLVAAGKRIDYHRSTAAGAAFTEWYVNSPKGVEQGFTLPAPPRPSRPMSCRTA